MTKKAVLCWSGGKDCAWALQLLRVAGVEVSALVTTFDLESRRVAMHGVRRELAELQAAALGVSLWPVDLPSPCPNEECERRMAEVCRRAADAGIDAVAFGDLYLEDLRAYRERNLAGTGLEPLFPLWGLPTAALSRDMIAGGLRARVVSVDAAVVPRELAGREYDAAFLAELPESADPCGENGEFHTFVYGGPMFLHPVAVRSGGVREEGRFIYTDLLPA